MIQRRQGFSKIEWTVSFGIFLILAAVIYPVYRKVTDPKQYASCSSNLKQIGIAMLQYSQDNDEHLPSVAFNNVSQSLPPYKKPFGWADALQPYLKRLALLQCPQTDDVNRPEDATQRNFTDYWFNSNLSGIAEKELPLPAQTLLAGDGNDGTDETNARYNLNALPQSWRNTENSPARRHLGVANYLYADGHVKSLRPQKINNLPVSQNTAQSATFSVR